MGRQRQTRDGCVGGRGGKWVNRQMHCGMNGWAGEMAKWADRDRQINRQTSNQKRWAELQASHCYNNHKLLHSPSILLTLSYFHRSAVALCL